MNERIDQLKSRVGLDDNKAHAAAETVLQCLKQRLPPALASQLNSALPESGEGLKEKIGNVFQKKSA